MRWTSLRRSRISSSAEDRTRSASSWASRTSRFFCSSASWAMPEADCRAAATPFWVSRFRRKYPPPAPSPNAARTARTITRTSMVSPSFRSLSPSPGPPIYWTGWLATSKRTLLGTCVSRNAGDGCCRRVGRKILGEQRRLRGHAGRCTVAQGQ